MSSANGPSPADPRSGTPATRGRAGTRRRILGRQRSGGGRGPGCRGDRLRRAGSIRIPAAWTHLVGIKPQRGRISTWPLPEAFNGITVNGVLAAPSRTPRWCWTPCRATSTATCINRPR
ncbi:amidase family protein [Mycobacterium xenopi 3993]|nr:amidase family protein [Mycobacterium xenopi 3993]